MTISGSWTLISWFSPVFFLCVFHNGIFGGNWPRLCGSLSALKHWSNSEDWTQPAKLPTGLKLSQSTTSRKRWAALMPVSSSYLCQQLLPWRGWSFQLHLWVCVPSCACSEKQWLEQSKVQSIAVCNRYGNSCNMEPRGVMYHPAVETFPPLPQPIKAGTQSTQKLVQM